MGKFTVIGFAVLIVLLVVVGPFLTIWALNTLFPALNISYTIQTWFAVVLLGSLSNISLKKQ